VFLRLDDGLIGFMRELMLEVEGGITSWTGSSYLERRQLLLWTPRPMA